jgi:hypothetical protein
MSVFNLGGLVSRESGALIMYWLGITESNFDSLWLLLVTTNLIALLPMLFVKLLPGKEEMEYGVVVK